MKKLKKQFLAAVLTAVMAVIIPLSLGHTALYAHHSFVCHIRLAAILTKVHLFFLPLFCSCLISKSLLYIIQDVCIFYQCYFHIIGSHNVQFLPENKVISAFCHKI